MKIEIPDNKKLVFEMRMPIRWGDMDAMGHVNNASYFRYLETVRIDWMYSIGCVPDPTGEGPVIVNAFCTFHKQLEFPGDVIATGTPVGVGGNLKPPVWLVPGDVLELEVSGVGILRNVVEDEKV